VVLVSGTADGDGLVEFCADSLQELRMEMVWWSSVQIVYRNCGLRRSGGVLCR